MIFWHRPAAAEVRRQLERQAALPFSYAEVGATRRDADVPRRSAVDLLVVDHNRICVGRGADDFGAAVAAVRRWQMFALGWVELCWPEAPIAAGSTVGVLARLVGVWSLNAARIVYTIDEQGDVERFGFAYGTLPDHAERGEERFSVEWHRDDDSVWYDILAFSRPQWLTALGYPYARWLQKRFAAGSLRAMAAAVRP